MGERLRKRVAAVGLVCAAIGFSACSGEAVDYGKVSEATGGASSPACESNKEIHGSPACIAYASGVRIVKFLTRTGQLYSTVEQSCPAGELTVSSEVIHHSSERYGSRRMTAFIETIGCNTKGIDSSQATTLNAYIPSEAFPGN